MWSRSWSGLAAPDTGCLWSWSAAVVLLGGGVVEELLDVGPMAVVFTGVTLAPSTGATLE
jgi:hypothetical protein